MNALVIGATGIIGNHVVRALLAKGIVVSALSRGKTPSRNLDDLDVKRITGDINDVETLHKAFKGHDWIFQAAAYYPQNTFQWKHHIAESGKGVQNVIQAALKAGVSRLIYTSSLTTIGMVKKGQLADESIGYNLVGRDPHPYFLVKYLAEANLKEAHAKLGLPVVIVNPTGCFGPYELKPSSLCLVPQLMNRQIPAYLSHAGNVVDVADVGRGHVLAAKKGRLGERYILGGHNIDFAEVAKDICRVGGVKAPRFRAPVALALALGTADEAFSYLCKKSPHFPVLGVRFVEFGQYFSIEKAQRELGYKAGPMEPCYERAIAWYKKIGYC